MQPEQAINDPIVLDSVFVEMNKALKSNNVKMTQDQSAILIKLMLMEEENVEGLYKELSTKFPIGGMFKRCEIFPVKYDKRL